MLKIARQWPRPDRIAEQLGVRDALRHCRKLSEANITVIKVARGRVVAPYGICTTTFPLARPVSTYANASFTCPWSSDVQSRSGQTDARQLQYANTTTNITQALKHHFLARICL